MKKWQHKVAWAAVKKACEKKGINGLEKMSN